MSYDVPGMTLDQSASLPVIEQPVNLGLRKISWSPRGIDLWKSDVHTHVAEGVI